MTSDNHDITNAVEILGELVRILTDPMAGHKLKQLETAVKATVERAQGEPDVEHRKWPEKGTCPTCRKTYTFNDDGSLRRHGKGKCATDRQLPAEVIPAVLAIAQLGNDSAEVSDGRTQDNSDN